MKNNNPIAATPISIAEFDEYRHPTPNPIAATPGISYVKFFSLNLD